MLILPRITTRVYLCLNPWSSYCDDLCTKNGAK
uniref:Sodium channel toxin meuNaTx-13 n=1 Tax=Mesobuthus eupeus TaxID=34648 RepID=A0A146CIS5_MESEU|nr:sodium channel toxin meuNaTx-13 [Mesobuthus eupeus]